MNPRLWRKMGGDWLRGPLRWIPEKTVVPVLSGPLRGLRWVVGSAPHGAWLGTLERAKLRHFTERLRKGMTVWDIGANVGLYALAGARAVGVNGRVYAFEPWSRNLNFLERHLVLNAFSNVTVVPKAVANVSGILRMAEGNSPSEFQADPLGVFQLPSITLDEWSVEMNAPMPDAVKIDVEGSEDTVLQGGSVAFSTRRPLIYLALHGNRQRGECGRLLTEWGYRIESLEKGRAPEVSSEWFAEAAARGHAQDSP